MKLVFLLFATFLLTTQPLRSFHFSKNLKINSGIDSSCNGGDSCSISDGTCSVGDEPCSNNNEMIGNGKLKKIIDALLRPQQIPPKIMIFPKITRECEEGDWESGEIPWDFVENGNVSVALDPHSIAMLLL